MTMPDGVQTCTVTISVPLDVFGNPAKSFTGKVRTDRDLIWAATGEVIWRVETPLPAPVDGAITFEIPLVDQPGVLGSDGTPITNWSYRASTTATWAQDRRTSSKAFQVFADTVPPLSLDLIPDGASVPPVDPGDPYVSSFAGQSGAITTEVVATVVDAVTADLLTNPTSDTFAASDAATATQIATPGSDTATALTAAIAGTVEPVVNVHELRKGARPLEAKRMFGGYLAKWDAAVQLVRAGVRDAKILVVGDSTAAGVGGGTDGTFPQAASWVDGLADLLNEGLAPAANGLQIPRSSSAANPTDDRWTLGTGWTKGDAGNATTAYVGFGGMGCNYYAASDAAGTLTFNDPRIEADTFDVYYMVTTVVTGATFTAQATGGSASSAVPVGGQAAKGIQKVTVSAGSASTTNVVTIDPGGSGGQVYIVGIEPYLSTTKKIRVGNAGTSGSYAFRWVAYSDSDPGNAWNARHSIRAYAPDLTIIDLGINDADPTRNTPAATFIDFIEDLIADAQVSGDVLLKTFIPVAGRETYLDQYAAELRDRDLALVDIYGAWGSAEDADAAGFINPDGVHGSAQGYAVEAAYMYVALTQRPDGTDSGPKVTEAISGPAGVTRQLAIQTDGVSRWIVRASSHAESGSNAGSNLEILSRSDAGAALKTVLTIARDSGHISIADGSSIATGTGTGSRIGHTATQKLGFWGKTPAVQPTALTAADASPVDSTYGAEEAAVIANLRTRLNELETKLKAIGLLA